MFNFTGPYLTFHNRRDVCYKEGPYESLYVISYPKVNEVPYVISYIRRLINEIIINLMK